jgi:tryptophan synthase alpha chain
MLVDTNHLDLRVATGRPLLTCYFPLGDPLFDDDMLALYARCGVDILELGVPTLDPFMDGADVASAMRTAIDSGADIPARLAEVAGWLRADPARPAGVCMAYPDIDYAAVLSPENRARIDGLLLLGLESRADADAILADAGASGMRIVRFVSTALGEDEVAKARAADGYVMLQARAGVTGPSADVDEDAAGRVTTLRAAGVASPILLGFGISTPDQAAEAVAMGAEGVIIGSMCIRKAREGSAVIEAFLSGVRAALDARDG